MKVYHTDCLPSHSVQDPGLGPRRCTKMNSCATKWGEWQGRSNSAECRITKGLWRYCGTKPQIVWQKFQTGSSWRLCRLSQLAWSLYHIELSNDSRAPYTLSVKLSDLTVWRHTWRKNWVNCGVLTGNSAGLRIVFSSRLSHRELCSWLRESHSFLNLPVDTTMASSQGTQQNW
jgi:hypothetical protein